MTFHWQEMSEETLWAYLRDGLGPINRIVRLALVKKICQILEVSEEKAKIMDVGCGTGTLYENIKDENLDVEYLGIDITSKIIEINRNAFPEARWEIQDANNIKLKSNSFDIVVCKDLLEHIQNYRKPVEKFLEISRKRVLLAFFNASNSLEKTLISRIKNKYYWNTISRFELEAFLKSLDGHLHIEIIEFKEDPHEIKKWAERALREYAGLQQGSHCIYSIDKFSRS